MESPCTLLALFAAVFGSSASATLGKLTSVLFPLAALVVSTLADASTGIVLAAEISHDHTSPVLHISAVVTNCELLNEWKKVEVVVKQILFVVGIFVVNLRNFILFIHSRRVLVNGGKLLANLEARHKVTLLEIRAKTTVLRDVESCAAKHGVAVFHGDILDTHRGLQVIGASHLRLRADAGRTVGERIWGGGNGVVGESQWPGLQLQGAAWSDEELKSWRDGFLGPSGAGGEPIPKIQNVPKRMEPIGSYP
ncbi:hypothetical protein HG530_007310 [Fusarium avenaceum]|nr:hypothetical protein HG530_007310 [Fusarium avenaceum]